MSFYFDDDDDEDGALDPSQDQDSFLCTTCGSDDSYTDDAGTQFCSQCFSQSQTQTNEAELEYEDVQALGARAKGGRILAAAYQRGRRSSMGLPRKNGRKPLHVFDTSQPLPTIDECLRAYTTVIQISLTSIFPLLNVEPRHHTVITNSVRNTWLQYLKWWQEGADFYREYHPEMRLVMRDLFLPPTVRRELNRHLLHRAIKLVKREREAENKDNESDKSDDDESDDDDDDDENSDNEEGDADSDEDKKDLGNKMVNEDRVPSASLKAANILNLQRKYKRQGRQDAALKLAPNMTLVAAILLTVLCKFGVTASHIMRWIAIGKLPLLDAFEHCFDDNLQSRLRPIARTFRLNRVPKAHHIEYRARLLLVAANQKPTFVTPASIPLLAARLVSDLQLSPGILNCALALMGREPLVALKDQSMGQWLPVPLIKRIERLEDVLAAIAVACKLTPGWDTGNLYANSDSPIPWNEDQVPLVLQRSTTASYLNFVDSHVMAGRGTEKNIEGKKLIPDFIKGLETKKELESGQDTTTTTTTTTQPPILLAGAPNPNQPSRKRAQKHHKWKLQIKRRKATWVDANGKDAYVAYKKEVCQLQNCHPDYQLLLETMAHVTEAKALDIHRVVQKLDIEILHRCRPECRRVQTGNYAIQINKRKEIEVPRTTPVRRRLPLPDSDEATAAIIDLKGLLGDSSSDDEPGDDKPSESDSSSSSDSKSESGSNDNIAEDDGDFSQALF